MSLIHVTTQFIENYGAHDYETTGKLTNLWKFKGGHDYLISDTPEDEFGTPKCADVLALITRYENGLELNSKFGITYPTQYKIVKNNYKTREELALNKDTPPALLPRRWSYWYLEDLVTKKDEQANTEVATL